MVNDFFTQSGLYVPTNFIWDMQQLQEIDVTSSEFKELLVRLYQNLNVMAIALNLKDSGYYITNEFLTGSLLYPNPNVITESGPVYRQIFREVVFCGPLPNNTTVAYPHNIPIDPLSGNSTYSFLKIYGAASKQTGGAESFLPLPYVSVSGDAIEVNVDNTDVNITTQSNRSSYTIAYIILEYIKQ